MINWLVFPLISNNVWFLIWTSFLLLDFNFNLFLWRRRGWIVFHILYPLPACYSCLDYWFGLYKSFVYFVYTNCFWLKGEVVWCRIGVIFLFQIFCTLYFTIGQTNAFHLSLRPRVGLGLWSGFEFGIATFVGEISCAFWFGFVISLGFMLSNRW